MTSRIRQRGLGSSQSLLKKRRHSHKDSSDIPYSNNNQSVTGLSIEHNSGPSARDRDSFTPPSFEQSPPLYPDVHRNHFDFTGWGFIIFILLTGKILWITYYLHLFEGSVSYTLLFIGIALMILGSVFVLGNRWRGEWVSMRENESIDVHNPDGPPGGISPQMYGNVLSDSIAVNHTTDDPMHPRLPRDTREVLPRTLQSQW